MYCVNCGKKIEDNQKYCTNCGFNNSCNNKNDNNDKSSVLLNVIGFIWPLIGLIIFICTKDKNPIKAKKVGKWSLIGFITKISVHKLFTGCP